MNAALGFPPNARQTSTCVCVPARSSVVDGSGGSCPARLPWRIAVGIVAWRTSAAIVSPRRRCSSSAGVVELSLAQALTR
jgi:hypothetical protein